MSVKFCCDFCGMPLVRDLVDDPEGFYDKIPCTRFYNTKTLNTKSLFPDLCKSCADNLDRTLEFAKDVWLKEIDISVRNSKINDVRRKLLGTKG